MEEFVWYYADQQALAEKTPLGPVSIRDLDVLYRTSAINSAIYVWKDGMTDWVQLYKVQELKEAILDEQQNMEIIQSLYEKQQQELVLANQKGKKQQKIQDKLDQKNIQNEQKLKEQAQYNEQMNKQNNILESNGNKQGQKLDEADIFDEDDDEEEQEYLKLLQDNPEEAIKRMAENALNSHFYFSEDDKKWNICREDENNQRIWVQQDEEPREEMELMRNELLEKLRLQFSTENIKDDQKLKENLKNLMDEKNAEEDAIDPKEKEVYQGMNADQIRKMKRNKKKAKRAAQKKKEKWYQARVNTYIYVKGLPHSITEDQLDEFFSRAGVIRRDPITNKKKIKIYEDEEGKPKGDAVISYQMIESIELAITMLDEREIEPGHVIKIERAQFNQHGEEYKKREAENLEKEKQLDKIQQMQLKAAERQALGWEDEDAIDAGLKIVIIKNIFTLQEAEGDDTFFDELKAEIAREIESSCGPIQRLKIFEENPEGVVEIKFKNSSDAEACIEKMNGRFFDERELQCFFWDGATDYKRFQKQVEDDEQRLEDFGKWLENKGSENGEKQE